MAEVIKIVLTGGPCAGKTTALGFLKTELESCGLAVVCVPETAAMMIKAGKTPQNMGIYDFHSELFEKALQREKAALRLAKSVNAERAVVLFDRGLLDSRAYVCAEDFARYSARRALNEELIRNSYDAVFHMVTAARGAEKSYRFGKELTRGEDASAARELDDRILAAWTGTPHLRVVDNSTDFEHKLERLLCMVKSFAGIPRPLEIERKFLIKRPDENLLDGLKFCRRIFIEQAYLSTPDEGNFRIRKRGEGCGAVFIKTVKTKISDLKRIETENYISKKEYYDYLTKNTEHVSGVIRKYRYCIVDRGFYYELDLYPFWNDVATIEIELDDENDKYVLPDFIDLVREVTFEPEYRNFALARKYGVNSQSKFHSRKGAEFSLGNQRDLI